MESSVAIRSNNTVVVTNKAEESNDLIDQLPEEIMLHIFSYLSAPDLAKSCTVCKKWSRLGSDLTLWLLLLNKLPFLRVIGSDWTKQFDLVSQNISTEMPTLDKRTIISILKKVGIFENWLKKMLE